MKYARTYSNDRAAARRTPGAARYRNDGCATSWPGRRRHVGDRYRTHSSYPAERAATAIKVENYGEAAALDLYGRGLPPALSGHNQYYLWGLRGQRPSNVLSVQDNMEGLKPYCRRATLLGITGSRYAMAFENGKVIALCEGVKPPLTGLWPRLKLYS